MRRRDVIGAGLGAGLSFAQTASVIPDVGNRTPPRGGPRGSVPVRKVKTTPLFKSPQGYPNALRAVPEGFWIAEQLSGAEHLLMLHREGRSAADGARCNRP